MTTAFTARDVLNDIEIELLQGVVTQDDLGQSVQNVRRFQNKVRGETVDATTRPDYREIANRQFQINDMLLTLVQETATRLKALELELRKAERAGFLATPGELPAGGDAGAAALPVPDASLVRRLEAIQSAMRDDALLLQMEVIPSETPLVGKALGGLRSALHSLVVFYANRLAAKQIPINRLYGDSLEQLYQASDRQQADLAALRALVAALQARLNQLERQA